MTPSEGDLDRRQIIKRHSSPGYIEISKSRSMTSLVFSDALKPSALGTELATAKLSECFVLPIIEPENSLLSKTYTTFLDASRGLMENGIDIIGPDFIAVDLLFRERLPSDDPLSVSVWACNIVNSFGYHDEFVLLAAVMMYTRLIRVRWLAIQGTTYL